jgi:hypothetical protein
MRMAGRVGRVVAAATACASPNSAFYKKRTSISSALRPAAFGDIVIHHMLQAHSFLWHYLWVAPNVILAALGILPWRKGLRDRFPIFVLFALLSSITQIVLYVADVSPSVSAENFWRIFLGVLVLDGFLKVALISEIFANVFGSYRSVVHLGKTLIRAIGTLLLLGAVAGAAYAQRDNYHWLISGTHLLEQTIYLVESGLVLFIFLFARYFKLTWNNTSLGIALGLAISSCVHLATWTVMANGGLLNQRHLLDFINMATYHLCVLIWCYYLLVPQKEATKSAVSLPDNNLAIWNRELERLLQQ